jgi:hypothetical protein
MNAEVSYRTSSPATDLYAPEAPHYHLFMHGA